MGNRNEKHVSSAYVRMKQQSARFIVNILCTRFEFFYRTFTWLLLFCTHIKWNDVFPFGIVIHILSHKLAVYEWVSVARSPKIQKKNLNQMPDFLSLKLNCVLLGVVFCLSLDPWTLTTLSQPFWCFYCVFVFSWNIHKIHTFNGNCQKHFENC